MQKKVISFVSACLFICGSLAADINTIQVLKNNPKSLPVKEGVVISIPENELQSKWDLAYQEMIPNGSWVIEWIPKGESIEDWSQLIQLQFLPASLFGGAVISAEDFSKYYIQALKDKFPEIISSVASTPKNSVLIDWALPKPSLGEKAQHELTKVFVTPEGIYRLAFTVKTPEMDSQLKKEWSDRLNSAQIVENKSLVESKP